MEQNTLCRGDTVKLISKPTGYVARHLPLTLGKTYTVLDFDCSNIVTTTDDPEIEGHYWRGRVEKVQ